MVSSARGPGGITKTGRDIDLSMSEQNVRIARGNEAFRWAVLREERVCSQKLDVILTSVAILY